MIARNYTRLVQFYRTENVADGFGGNTVLDLSIGNYWAEVKPISSNNDTSQGKDVLKNNYSFVIRLNNFIEPYLDNLSILYNGQKYIVNSFEYVDTLFRFVKITANLSIGEPLDLASEMIFQDSLFALMQNGNSIIYFDRNVPFVPPAPPIFSVPGSPTSIVAVAGNSQAIVSFIAPVDNGNSAITSYTATSNPQGVTATINQSGSGSITVTGLTNNIVYVFTVRASNAIGASAASTSSNAITPTVPITVPNAPTSITAVAGDARAVVSFVAPVSNGGSVITSYTATSSPEGITGAISQSGSGSITVLGLTNGTVYTFTIKATNAIGFSAASVSSNSVTPVAAGLNPQTIINNFKIRVAADGGTFEAEANLLSILTILNNTP